MDGLVLDVEGLEGFCLQGLWIVRALGKRVGTASASAEGDTTLELSRVSEFIGEGRTTTKDAMLGKTVVGSIAAALQE